MKRMKILVIDDSPIHRQAARQTLDADHDLTVIGGHDEAMEAVCKNLMDMEKFLRLKEEAKSEWKGEIFRKAWDACQLPYWDAVLSDLLMPAGKNAQGGPGLQYVGIEMAVGWSLAVYAALNGAKYVAVVTAMNHHHHPASAMLDGMDREIFDLNGAKALFTNYVDMVGIVGTEKTCFNCGGSGERSRDDGSTFECYFCNGTGTEYGQRGKDWGKILKLLTRETTGWRE